MRNLQGQLEKALCYQKLFWPFTVSIFIITRTFFFLAVGQNNFGNLIPFPSCPKMSKNYFNAIYVISGFILKSFYQIALKF